MSQQRQQLELTVRTLSLAKRHEEAIALAKRAVSTNPNDASCHFILSHALIHANRREEGMFHADRAATLDIKNPTYACFAGQLYTDFRLFEYALPLLQRSVALESRAPESQLALAQCYEEVLRPEKATEHYAKALSLEDSRAKREQIQCFLARNLAQANQRELAEERFEQLFLGKGPTAFTAAVELAFLRKEGPDSRIGRYLAKSIADKALRQDKKALGLIALGRLHNNIKDYDRAFGCWQASRNIEKSLSPQLRDHPKLFQKSKATYSSRLFESLAPFGSQTDAVVIICGMPRSGTTLTEQIIASHSQAGGAGEAGRWGHLEEEFLERHSGKDLVNFFTEANKGDELRIRGEEILRILMVMSGSSAPRIVEKTPHSFASLGYIKLCCPKAKFIHIQRHPLDTFVSTYQNAFNPSHGYAFDQVEYAREYVWHIQMMNLWKSLFPDNIFSIKYEDLAREPEVHARRIIEFIGLPWEDQCLEFHRGNRAVRTFSTAQVRQPVHDFSIGRWKNYRKHLGPIMEQLTKGGIDWENDW